MLRSIVVVAVILTRLLCGSVLAQESRATGTVGVAPDTAGASRAVEVAEADRDSPARSRSWILLPHLYFTPETGLAGGAVAGYYPGGGLAPRPSSVLSSFTLTAHRQVMVETTPDLYLAGGRYWVTARLAAKKYPDVFYGIGHATTAEMEEDFTSRSFTLEVQAQREVANGSWLGLRLRMQAEDVVEVEAEGLLAGGAIVGAAGGTVIGLGAVATRDTRDRIIAPRGGTLAEAKWTGFTPTIGSDHRFGLLSVDARHYVAAGSGVLALRGHAEAAQGAAPFTLLPKLGGSRLLRGYREGRFRDDLLGVVEAEYRFPVVWRFGGVVFGGVGDVAPAPDALPPLGELERAVGAGLRFRLNQAGVNIRIDWARGREDGGLYVGLGEAF